MSNASKEAFSNEYPDAWNPYGALPKMHLLVYELPPTLREVAMSGSRNEFDLNEFFRASGSGSNATFEHKDQVQAWLQWLRGQDLGSALDALEAGTAKPFPLR